LSRRSARDTAFRLYYEYAVTGEFNHDTMIIMRDCFEKGMNEKAWEYVLRVIDIYDKHGETIDKAISLHSNKWNISHIAKVELSILRLGICEIIYCDDIHEAITINECVELAKKYASDKSAGFVNGIFAAVVSNKNKIHEQV